MRRHRRHCQEMQIFIKTQSGKIITVDIEAYETIDNFKAMIQAKEGIPPERQQLSAAGRHLEADRTLEELNIHHESVIHMRCNTPIRPKIAAKPGPWRRPTPPEHPPPPWMSRGSSDDSDEDHGAGSAYTAPKTPPRRCPPPPTGITVAQKRARQKAQKRQRLNDAVTAASSAAIAAADAAQLAQAAATATAAAVAAATAAAQMAATAAAAAAAIAQ